MEESAWSTSHRASVHYFHQEHKLSHFSRLISPSSSNISLLKSDITLLQSDTGLLKSDIRLLQSDTGLLKSDIRLLSTPVFLIFIYPAGLGITPPVA